MKPQAIIKHYLGNVITLQNDIVSLAETFLTKTAYRGDITLEVQNTNPSPTGIQLVLVGGLGNGNTEIASSSAITNNQITVAAISQNHNRGDKVNIIQFDTVEVHKSPSVSGTFTLLTTQMIDVSRMFTKIEDKTGVMSDVYKLRFKNSITNQVSDFSEEFSVESYSDTSAGKFLNSVRLEVGISDNDKHINQEFLLNALNSARKMVATELYKVRQPWLARFETPIRMLSGRNYVELPEDIDMRYTNQSLLSARFITNSSIAPFHLAYVDKQQWNALSYTQAGTETDVDANIGASILRVKNLGEIPKQGGTLFVATNDFSESVLSIEYTGVDENTSSLTGVTGVTRAIPKGTQIWVRASMNQPTGYTVFDGKLWFNAVIPDKMQGGNVYIDYYAKMEEITDYYDEIIEEYRESYRPYIRWAIKYRKDNKISTQDVDMTRFEQNVQSILQSLYSGQDTNIITN